VKVFKMKTGELLFLKGAKLPADRRMEQGALFLLHWPAILRWAMI